jgi:hypothetical protein
MASAFDVKPSTTPSRSCCVAGSQEGLLEGVPGIYKGVIRQIVRDDDAVLHVPRDQPTTGAGP